MANCQLPGLQGSYDKWRTPSSISFWQKQHWATYLFRRNSSRKIPWQWKPRNENKSSRIVNDDFDRDVADYYADNQACTAASITNSTSWSLFPSAPASHTQPCGSSGSSRGSHLPYRSVLSLCLWVRMHLVLSFLKFLKRVSCRPSHWKFLVNWVFHFAYTDICFELGFHGMF